MSGRIQTRLALFAAFVAVVGVLIPAGLAGASHDGANVAAGDPSYLRLRLGSVDNVTWRVGSSVVATQSIVTKKNDCTAVKFGSSPSLLTVSPVGGQLGEVKDGLGVKSPSDGSGEPCGRVDASRGEQISVALGSALSGNLMTAIDVDLELKFNAAINVIFKHEGATVHTLTGFTGSGGSDDGPDSGDGDNYRLNYRPLNDGTQVYFDQVVFVPTAGSMSLEGGADGTENGTLDPNVNNWSQFEVVPTFDGQITCGDIVSLGNAEVGVLGEVTMLALDLGSGWDVDCTQLKNYNEEVTPSFLEFAPFLESSEARYSLSLTIHDQPINTNSSGQMTSLIMKYSDGMVGSPDRPLFPCLTEPQLDDETWLEQASTGMLPSGEFACFYEVQVTPLYNVGSQAYGTELWSIYFEDDPKFSFG